ncbi:hypothetical protein ABZ614_28975 [Streptomyces sp. NPDC013178]|uniref:hypothetical protein n=1 Tax=Streptomyces sp. NPDC013178 TaxID=3155118 RepID=UPI00340E4711
MPALTLLSAVLEETVQWKYGTAGTIGLLLLTVGIKCRRPTMSSAGAVILALLVTGPAVSS